MLYKLTLPKNWKPSWWKKGDPIEYILCDGKHQKRYDLVTKKLSKELIERMYECNQCQTFNDHINRFERDHVLNLVDQWLEKPLGLDEWEITQSKCKFEKID